MIPARRPVEPAETAAPFLKIWTEPADSAHTITSRVNDIEALPADPSAHRIRNPVRKPESRRKSSTTQKELWSGVGPEVLAAALDIERQFSDPVVPAHQREWIAENLSLRQFWTDWLLPDQARRVQAGKLSAASVSKTRQALNRWERLTRPGDWAADQPWPGFPIGRISSRFATHFLEQLARTVKAATVKSTWGHLRTIFNHAVRVRALTIAPKPEPITVPSKKTAIFTDKQIQSAYVVLTRQVSLQVAFVLAINTGIRPVDLFLLRWSDFTWGERPSVTFTARKTGKTQTLPLGAVTLRHIARLPNNLPEAQGYLFGHLTNVAAKDPERSHAARERNDLFKRLLAVAGITFPKPWQACRATCNERLESHREGSGQFMLGHGSTLNSKSYREPSQLIYEAVNSVPQPDCFHHF